MDTTNPKILNRKALIMVVDDNPEFLDGIRLTLQMEGFDVWTAPNGQQALDELSTVYLRQNQEGSKFSRLPDLILADIMMPVMDGHQFYNHVRNNLHLYHIPFIFLTAKSSEADVRQGKELGSDDYLTKPCPPEDVLATIRGKLKRVERRRFFDMMSEWTEEHRQSFVTQTDANKLPFNISFNQIIIFTTIVIVIIIINIIAVILLPS